MFYAIARYELRKPLVQYSKVAHSISWTGFQKTRAQHMTLLTMDRNIGSLHALRVSWGYRFVSHCVCGLGSVG